MTSCFQSEMKIRLNNTKKGLTTVWSLEKFESAMEQMRELYQVCLNSLLSCAKAFTRLTALGNEPEGQRD